MLSPTLPDSLTDVLGISRRTGIAARTVLWQGSLLFVLCGVVTLWHPMVGMSSAQAIHLPVSIGGVMLLISGMLLFLIAIDMLLGVLATQRRTSV